MRGALADKVAVRDPAGRIEQLPLVDGRAELRCLDKAGPMQIEIRGKDGSLLARFPIACGAEPAASVAVEAGSVEPAAQERAVFEQINAVRRAAGIPELVWDDAVAKAARAISEATREGTGKGVQAAGVDPVLLLQKAGIVSQVVLENPAQAHSSADAQARFEASAVHRANLLNPQVTHAGVGVAVATGAGVTAFVTELFVREAQAIDIAKARDELRAALGRKRASKAQQDQNLDAIAQRYAEALAEARGELSKSQADALAAPLYKGYRTVNLISGAKPDALEFAAEPGALGPGKLLGLGIAQGDSRSLGKNAVYGVVILAAPR